MYAIQHTIFSKESRELFMCQLKSRLMFQLLYPAEKQLLQEMC